MTTECKTTIRPRQETRTASEVVRTASRVAMADCPPMRILRDSHVPEPCRIGHLSSTAIAEGLGTSSTLRVLVTGRRWSRITAIQRASLRASDSYGGEVEDLDQG